MARGQPPYPSLGRFKEYGLTRLATNDQVQALLGFSS
jgi:hypothetical protein